MFIQKLFWHKFVSFQTLIFWFVFCGALSDTLHTALFPLSPAAAMGTAEETVAEPAKKSLPLSKQQLDLFWELAEIDQTKQIEATAKLVTSLREGLDAKHDVSEGGSSLFFPSCYIWFWIGCSLNRDPPVWSTHWIDWFGVWPRTGKACDGDLALLSRWYVFTCCPLIDWLIDLCLYHRLVGRLIDWLS